MFSFLKHTETEISAATNISKWWGALKLQIERKCINFSKQKAYKEGQTKAKLKRRLMDELENLDEGRVWRIDRYFCRTSTKIQNVLALLLRVGSNTCMKVKDAPPFFWAQKRVSRKTPTLKSCVPKEGKQSVHHMRFGGRYITTTPPYAVVKNVMTRP